MNEKHNLRDWRRGHGAERAATQRGAPEAPDEREDASSVSTEWIAGGVTPSLHRILSAVLGSPWTCYQDLCVEARLLRGLGDLLLSLPCAPADVVLPPDQTASLVLALADYCSIDVEGLDLPFGSIQPFGEDVPSWTALQARDLVARASLRAAKAPSEVVAALLADALARAEELETRARALLRRR